MAKTVASCPPPAVVTTTDPMMTPTAVMSVLLFDDAGNIVHGHQEVFLAGAAQPLATQVEANARRVFAAQNPNKSSNVGALHLDGALSDNLCMGATYKVVDCQLMRG